MIETLRDSRLHALARCRAFTLIEVVLAVTILSGMLVGVLSLYQQSASLRNELEQEMDTIAGARLLMDHMTTELECAVRHASLDTSLIGTSHQLKFLTTALSDNRIPGGLRVVRYELDAGEEVSASVEERGIALPDVSAVDAEANVSRVVEGERIVRHEVPFSAAQNDASEDEASVDLDDPVETVSDRLRVLKFRYFDGSDWSASWSHESLPLAVEIALAASATEFELATDGDRGLAFTRLVHLPAAHAIEVSSEEETAETVGEAEDSADDTDEGGEL
jgi:prepilin-type N-terminal cleavage/methylation domain-containing protein